MLLQLFALNMLQVEVSTVGRSGCFKLILSRALTFRDMKTFTPTAKQLVAARNGHPDEDQPRNRGVRKLIQCFVAADDAKRATGSPEHRGVTRDGEDALTITCFETLST